MPAYYWIMLYKETENTSFNSIVQNTVGGLLEGGCQYKLAETSHLTGVIPEHKKVSLDHKGDFTVDEAIAYAIKYLKYWKTARKAKRFMQTITLVFECNFRFSKEVKKELEEKNLKLPKQLRLRFSVTNDDNFGKTVTIDMDTWEEFVVSSWLKEAEYNKKQIIKFVTSVCNQVNPYLGWTDEETWVGNKRSEFLIVGSHNLDRISKYKSGQKYHLYKKLQSGGVILHQPRW